ncbi:hypothetical protein Acy02nite_80380 [Actinoplanes cyaneus]|uniref:Transposase n=1 Tax=Actinoplanes cyaneus TaxID=52696 RepID=A0A919ITG0_9ACTN|nr:hypothetical protein [Actinoplanes cyaneus]MCW2140811.1 hypothetical protein [Actinoplanes cyaneus]GID70157.1 hypothetical protein Acy02nite_80380 [Actinoplanes cyaneus]
MPSTAPRDQGPGTPRDTTRDYDGLYKALLEAFPQDALRLLCGVDVGDDAVVADGPTEQTRQRSTQRDRVLLSSGPDGTVDVHHVEVQV